VCDAFDETSAILVRPIAPSTTSVQFAGAIAAGDSISYSCRGF
jgi:hypothetical protein